MKKYLFLILITLVFKSVTVAQVTRAMTARYNNASVKGNIVFVANNIVTTPAGITTEMPPGGLSSNNSNPCVNIDIDTDVPAHTSKIPFGSVWNYHSNGAAPVNDGGGNTWKVPAYVMPAAWNVGGSAGVGPGKYGFSNPGNVTILNCMPSGGGGTVCVPTGNKYSAYYFRKTVNFTAPELAAFSTVLISMKRIDGIVVYINGVERIRDNMPAGAINYGTFARNDIGFAQENTVFYADPSYFNAGVNTIAVEVHTAVAGATNMAFDMEMLGINAASTFNSSSATLNLNLCSQVLFAGLYWGGNHQQNGNSDTSWIKQETKVKFKVPGSSSYQIITSTQTDYHNGIRLAGPPALVHAGYASFADVTSLINATSPNGVYTVGDVTAPIGWNSGGAGWTLVVAYSNPTEIQRNLTVFDGSAIVKIAQPALLVPISGFLTPPSGPVSCELGVVVYDGDRGTGGGIPTALLDSFLFKQNSNPLVGIYTNLTPNATSTLNNMFNSTISTKGVLNGGRNPSHDNTLGFDADIIEVPNVLNAVLGNGQTSASIRIASPQEDFMVQVLTTSISIYNPSFAFDKDAIDLSVAPLTPGDSLRYKMSYNNVGNDASTNSRIIDNIPSGTAFKPGSIRIGTVFKTDAAGDDEAEYDFTNSRIVYRLGTGANAVTGGEIAAGAKDSVFFDVYMPSACAVLSCSGTMRNRARMSYGGKLSLQALQDSSGVYNAGCIDPVDKLDIVTGTCSAMLDTILTNTCSSVTVMLPVRRYAGYTFHSGIPFTPFNRYNPATAVTFTRVMYAYYDAPGACLDDTARINIYITGCPDIDDDNDGLPDYLELNNPFAIGDADADGKPNWYDTDYTYLFIYVYRDYNSDGFNDLFDPAADYDNDGIPNFYDTNYPLFFFVDSNGDGVNDFMDKDLDGIPNYLDLDSDNDGIPDTVESFGVDANGDGRIDNYSDLLDGDGLSDNVDGNTSGGDWLRLSGLGLGALDTDADLLPNYLDLDSDNDGIPDITEAFGTDAANSARVSVFTDTDGDGYTDGLDADVGNDLTAENSASSLLRTGTDAGGDGRTDSWPNKNIDADSKPNPYDLDSDGDGILDVTEAQFTDANRDARVDGAINTNGRNTALAALGSLTIPNTDGVGRSNPFDIDSDEDGIPDNIEGQTTAGYLLPAGYLLSVNVDADADGINDRYDGFFGFGGNGIILVGINPVPVNTDADAIPLPDYLDTDTDNDGLIDRIEGNDFNFNNVQDDNVTLTGTDTDGDGLDDRFDANNSSAEGTSARMGDLGIITGDATPGSTTVVQRTAMAWGCPFERDWRCIPFVLSCEFLNIKATLAGNTTRLNWEALCKQQIDYFIIERSTDRQTFTNATSVPARSIINEVEAYNTVDDVTAVTADIIYYRIKAVAKDGRINYSTIVAVRKQGVDIKLLQILPNPVTDQLQILISSKLNAEVTILILDVTGKTLYRNKETLQAGSNTITNRYVASLASGTYYLKVVNEQINLSGKFNVLK